MGVIEELRKKYLLCKELIEIESKRDPETDPYRSKNKAKNILLDYVDTLKSHMEKTDGTQSEHQFCQLQFSPALIGIGMLCTEMEEFSEAVNYLVKGIEGIEGRRGLSSVCLSVQARNSLGYTWLKLSKPEEALKFLKEAEKLYLDFISDPVKVITNPMELWENLFPCGEVTLELSHTMTNFYLAQTYDVLKDLLKSGVYCHRTLKRRLAAKNYDPIDWAMNSVMLCQFFMDRNLLKQGRQHLAAASHILREYEESLKNMKDSQEDIDAKREELRHRSADLSWCWAKYGLYILQHSSYKLSNPEDEVTDKTDETEATDEDLNKLCFEDLDLEHYENQLPNVDVVTFEDAREVFLTSQRYFNKAKEYYTLEDRASKYAEIVRDHSLLFKHLTAFEPDEKRQFKMLKKRACMLEVVLKELNPRFYMDICRQLWFEVGEVYHDLMQIKSRTLGDAPTPQASTKINSLIKSSIENFNHFLDSVKSKRTAELPDPIENHLLQPVLAAQFYIGRLYFKFISPDKLIQMENTKKSYEYFKSVVYSCEKSEQAKAAAGEKYQLSKELMPLLLLQMLKL